MCLDIIIAKQLITKREEYNHIDDVIRDILGIEHIYKSNITEW